MNKYQNYYMINSQTNFKANSNDIKKINLDMIKHFEKTHCYDQTWRNNFGRIEHFVGGLICLGMAAFWINAEEIASTVISLVGTYMNFGLDKMFHNIAMRKSQALVRNLKSQGIEDEEQIMKIVDLYLKKRGGIMYSSFVRKFQKDKIKQVAKGEQANQFNGLMTYIQNKYTLWSPDNEAQQIKAKRNIKKLRKFFYNFGKNFKTVTAQNNQTICQDH